MSAHHSKESFKGDFLLRSLHLDSLLVGGFDIVLGADEEYLYMCDWPNSSRHSQNLERIVKHFSLCGVDELVSNSTNSIATLSDKDKPTETDTHYYICDRDYICHRNYICHGEKQLTDPPYSVGENQILDETVEQLKQYLLGERKGFDLPVRPIGSEFQKKVWERLSLIPFGKTITYGQIAYDIGVKGGFQAVGTAVGSNPISIIIPCHRVLGSNSIGGYAGGLDVKRALLELEYPQESLFGLEL